MFEFDVKKSKANQLKHGINFEEAQKIWLGPYVEFQANSEYENRFAIIGPVAGLLYTCIYTIRADKIRLISCRRARANEKALYEKNIQGTS